MLPMSVIDLLFGWNNWVGKHSLDTCSSLMLDVDIVEGTKLSRFRQCRKFGDSIKILCYIFV